MDKNARIYIAGHRGLVGSAIVRNLEAKGYTNLITRTHAELDLTDAAATDAFFAAEKPEYVFLAAAKVGGIVANNSYPGRIHPRQPGDPDQRDPQRVQARRDAAAVSGLELHLPEDGAAADARRLPADRAARTDQPALRAGQDRRHRNVLELQPAVRHAVPGGDADQSVRPGRQLPPDATATSFRRCCASFTKRSSAATRRSPSGAPARRGANSSTATTWPTPASS
jgi:hypothetical protein